MTKCSEDHLVELDIQELLERVPLADTDWDGAPLNVNVEVVFFLILGFGPTIFWWGLVSPRFM